MSGPRYSERVRRHFASPAHAGDAGGATAGASRGDTRIVLSAVLADGRLARLRFRAYGCPHAIAATEEACSALEGRDVGALEGLDVKGIMADLEIPVEKTGLILLLEDAMGALHRTITAQN